MNVLDIVEAKSGLDGLIKKASENHEPIFITGEKNNAVLVSEEDRNSMSETIYLLSVPGMRESIREGIEEELSNCSKELYW